jgi:hypothetical protein
MANRFKEIAVEEEIVEEVKKPEPQATPKKKKKTGGVVKSLSAVFSGTYLSNEIVLKYIPFVGGPPPPAGPPPPPPRPDQRGR